MQELIIEAGRTERHYWRDLWNYRELFRVLAWRDVSVRYKQTVIGAAWALVAVAGRLAFLTSLGPGFCGGDKLDPTDLFPFRKLIDAFS